MTPGSTILAKVETAYGAFLAEGAREGAAPAVDEAANRRPHVLVYLLDGNVEDVGPATCVSLSAREVKVMLGDRVVALYPRRHVFMATHEAVPAEVLF